MKAGGIRSAILQRGWRQGSVLPDDALAHIRFADQGATLPAGAKAIVISQDCDILAERLEDEPFVEVAVGAQIPSIDPNFSYAKNPRKLDLDLARSGTSLGAVRLEMRLRGSVPRNLLAQANPSGEVADGAFRGFVNWIARRYDRAALPDAFNTRIRARKQFKKLREILKRAKHGQPLAVLIALGQQENVELKSGEPYEIGLYVVLEGTLNPGDEDWDNFEENVYAPFVRQFRLVEGVVVKVDNLLSEADLSWRDRRVHLRALDLDDLSFRDFEEGDASADR
jgi:hypothetical protein